MSACQGSGHTEGNTAKNVERDPWIHRSTRMKCRTCMYYVSKTGDSESTMIMGIGRCRRHAPHMNGYPVVFESDWCGDHKLNENA